MSPISPCLSVPWPQGKRLPLPDNPDVCPRSLAGLIELMWAPDPKLRPGAGEVSKSLSLILHKTQQAQGSP